MSIDFRDTSNKDSYTAREVDPEWMRLMEKLLQDISLNHAADIGCGGGLYTGKLSMLGAKKVTGIDYSDIMLETAKKNNNGDNRIVFRKGNAYHTDVPTSTFDLLLERAVIHHLDHLPAAFSEARRILSNGGIFIIQDRTPADCLLKPSNTHIRGHFFSLFPHLADKETERRYPSRQVVKELKDAGFTNVKEIQFWETRKKYGTKNELLDDIKSRRGRSILHELTDKELNRLLSYLDSSLEEDTKIIEKDRWTIWTAVNEKTGGIL